MGETGSGDRLPRCRVKEMMTYFVMSHSVEMMEHVTFSQHFIKMEWVEYAGYLMARFCCVEITGSGSHPI